MSARKKRSLSLAGIVIPAALLLTGCSMVSGLGFEEGITSVNDQSLSLWQGAWIAAGVVGVITFILIVWPAIFHRLKKDSPEFPKQTQYNVPVEILYTVIPFIIVAVLFVYTLQKQNVITAKTTGPAHEIEMGSDVEGAIKLTLNNLTTAKADSPTARRTLVIASDLVDQRGLNLPKTLVGLDTSATCKLGTQQAGNSNADFSDLRVILVGSKNSKINTQLLDQVQTYWTCYLNQLGITEINQQSDLSGF